MSGSAKPARRGTYFPAVAYTDVGKGREHDCMDAGGRTNQETESRSGSFTTLEKGMPFPARCALP